jgi:ubiquinone/menaquinone biosynthesis C-methylase UbiE
MDKKEYSSANRKAWNEAAPVHAGHNFEKLLKSFEQPGYSCLDETETAVLNKIGVGGKAVAQLCCNNGRELLSIKNLGAGFCVGFDISDGFIDQACKFAEAGKIDCQFLRTDVYEIPDTYNHKFDLVYITIGALTWLPDLEQFFGVTADLLKPDGKVFIYEMHPVAEMFECCDGKDPLLVRYSYFQEKPFIDENGLDYYGMTTYESSPSYSFIHKLSDIFNGLLKNGFSIEAFNEYPHDISNLFKPIENSNIRLPLSYTLVARR